MKTLLLAPMSQTPLAQLKNWLFSVSGVGVPVPVPVIDAVCGLLGALSVMISDAEPAPGLRMRASLGIAPLPSTRSWVPLSSARLIVIEALALVAATPNVATVAAAATNRERCGSILSPFALRDSQGWGIEGPSFHGTLVVGPPLPDDGLARLDAGLVLLAG